MSPEAIKKRARGAEQKQERQQQILEAAAALLVTLDYTQISMALVAKEAGIVKGTLYLYFKTKEDILKYENTNRALPLII